MRLAIVWLVLSACACLVNASPLSAAAQTSSTTAADVPKPSDDEVQILKYHNENVGANGYNFAFETSDGVSRKETATVKHVGSISVEGTVSWVGPDGVQYTLNYLADEHGFQPQGSHLPVAPEAV